MSSRLLRQATLFALLCALTCCTSQTPDIEPTQHDNTRPAAGITPAPTSTAITTRARQTPSPATTPAPRVSPSPAASPVPSPSPFVRSSPVPVVPDRTLHVKSVGGKFEFSPAKLDVMAGQIVEVIFQNDAPESSDIFHNWVLIKPGTQQAVAALGKDAGVDPDAVTYSPSVLASSRTVGPGQNTAIDFVAPDRPGTYPFMSFVDEQWKIMHGTLVVHPLKEAQPREES